MPVSVYLYERHFERVASLSLMIAGMASLLLPRLVGTRRLARRGGGRNGSPPLLPSAADDRNIGGSGIMLARLGWVVYVAAVLFAALVWMLCAISLCRSRFNLQNVAHKIAGDCSPSAIPQEIR